MTIVIIAALLVIGAFAYTLLIRPEDLPESDIASPVEHLEARMTRIRENLDDLEAEYGVGKLSDADYQKSKGELERELARAQKKIEAPSAAPVEPEKPASGLECPHCGAKFEQTLKFCGECGKPMSEETA